MPRLTEARNSEEDWTGIAAREERKRIQNRLNQRAKRRRIKSETTKIQPKNQAFMVEKWRLSDGASVGELQLYHAEKQVKQEADAEKDAREISSAADEVFGKAITLCGTLLQLSIYSKGCAPPISSFPLSSDHLIHLIHHNVLRAIFKIKAVLKTSTTLSKKYPRRFSPFVIDICDGFTVINKLPSKQALLPSSLVPTKVQMTLPHSSFLNALPWPGMRDNLIQMEGCYDVLDFCRDLFGEVGHYPPATAAQIAALSPVARQFLRERAPSDDYDDLDDLSARRNGLIIWGEPWETQSWEVTPGFVRKWGWALRNCNDLITATNRWRATRHESPLFVDADRLWYEMTH